MSCHSIYIVREPDGSSWYDVERYGRMTFASPTDLLADLAQRGRRDIMYADAEVWCQAWYVDRGKRLARFFHCRGREGASTLAAIRGDAAWASWDVELALEARHDIRVIAGLPPITDDYGGELDSWAGCAAAELITASADATRFPYRWDAVAEELRYEFYYNDRLALRVVDRDGAVRDHGFDAYGSTTVAALGAGPRLLDELRDMAPSPNPQGDYGALIDEQLCAIWLWGLDPIAPLTYAELRRRWPGWQIAREPDGLDGILRRTDHDVGRRLRYIKAIVVDPAGEPAAGADAAALLAAIHADTTADEPRRVYADLLLARGDERGALIHVQCELAALVRDDVRSPHRRALEAEELRLLRGCFRTVQGGVVTDLTRGFPSGLHTSIEALASARLLPQMPTVDELALSGTLDERQAAALLAAPGFAQIRALGIVPTGDALRTLAIGAPGQLRHLRLSIGDAVQLRAVVDALCEPEAFAGLEVLQLHGTMLDNEELARLCAQLAIPSLRRFVAETSPNPRLDARPFAALVRARGLGALDELQLGCAADDATRPLVFGAVPGLAGVTTLALAGSGDALDPAPLVAGFPALRHLRLTGFTVDATALAARPELAQLRTLELGNRVATGGLAALAASPYVALDELVVERPDLPAIVTATFGDRLVVRRR